MTQTPRETLVLEAVVSLVDSLLDDFDVVDLLTELTERCAQLLDVASVGLLLADPGRQLHLLAATSEAAHDLELFQLQAEEGPCLDCYTSGAPISAADLADAAPRWPRFVVAATEAGFASVHAVPMRAAGTVLGALGLFGPSPGSSTTLICYSVKPWPTSHAPTPASVLPRLQRALASRIVVEQAKGFVHERLDVPVPAAFALLRGYAREQGDHLTAVARRLISEPAARPAILEAMTRILADATEAVARRQHWSCADRSPCGQGHHRPGEAPAWPTAGTVAGERGPRCVAAAHAVDAAAGRSAGTAEINVLDGGFGPTEAGCGPEHQVLVEL